MTDYLLDTSIASQLMAGNEAALRRLEQLTEGDRIYTSVITEGELLYGALRSAPARRTRLLSEIAQLLADLTDVLPVTRPVAATYANLKQELADRGRIIPDNDRWIAAIAVAGDLTLVAHDEHFRRIETLRLEDWLEGPS